MSFSNIILPIELTKISKIDLDNFIINNEQYIVDLLLSDNNATKLKNIITDLKSENNKLLKEITDFKKIIELNQKRVGDHSMYKGEFQEKKIEIILKEYFSQNFEIIGDKHMKCMDIRVKHKVKEYIIGIECKYKKKITKQDIEKFKSDKLSNKFKGSVFLTTSAPIKDYVESINTYKVINDELYIYSDDEIYIIMILQHFINFIENNIINNTDLSIVDCIDYVSNLYTNWNNIKKCCIKMDTDFINYLNSMGLNLDNGHLYLTTKSKCKNNKSPYSHQITNESEINNSDKKDLNESEINNSDKKDLNESEINNSDKKDLNESEISNLLNIETEVLK